MFSSAPVLIRGIGWDPFLVEGLPQRLFPVNGIPFSHGNSAEVPSLSAALPRQDFF